MSTKHLDRLHPSAMTPAPQQRWLDRAVHGLGEFLLHYWAHLFTIAMGLLVFTAISIPFLSYLGLNTLAKPLFFSLHYVCAQIPSHSFYVFGHQLGLCERNFSIYSSMFLGSLLFVLSKKRMPGIPWWIWLLMTLPMALDGTTQMFGWRESNWILRLLTGTLFGFGNVWFALPLLHKTIMESPTVPMQPIRPTNHRLVAQDAQRFPGIPSFLKSEHQPQRKRSLSASKLHPSNSSRMSRK